MGEESSMPMFKGQKYLLALISTLSTAELERLRALLDKEIAKRHNSPNHDTVSLKG